MASSREETRGRSRFQAKYDDSDHDDLVSTLNIENDDDDDDDGDDDDDDYDELMIMMMLLTLMLSPKAARSGSPHIGATFYSYQCHHKSLKK